VILAPLKFLLSSNDFTKVVVADLRNIDLKSLGRFQNIGAQAQIGCTFRGHAGANTAVGLCG
jgi:hypothetical protein